MAMTMTDRPAAQPLYDVRCVHCHRLLFRAAGLARVEIVCADRRCRRMQTVRLTDGARPR